MTRLYVITQTARRESGALSAVFGEFYARMGSAAAIRTPAR